MRWVSKESSVQWNHRADSPSSTTYSASVLSMFLMAGLVRHVRQVGIVRDIVESGSSDNVTRAVLKFPYIVAISHT